jgi:UDP-N-acetylmuramoyl-tripeptide--D-alanyl-D-alanine ligase
MNARTKAYLKKGNVRVIAVVGSVGKTSTAHVLRATLGSTFKVHAPTTAYNTEKSVQLTFFDMRFATSPAGWFFTVLRLILKSSGRPDFTHAVVELGTDAPGDLAKFKWLPIDVLVISAITPEHMANFADLDAVAQEELSLVGDAGMVVANANAIRQKDIEQIASRAQAYSIYGKGSSYELKRASWSDSHTDVVFQTPSGEWSVDGLRLIGEHSFDAVLASLCVAEIEKIELNMLTKSLQSIEPVAGRMQVLRGKNGSVIIDDSYNASPDAVRASLSTIYDVFKSHKRIVLLGQMNELGKHSESYHREMGTLCDPKKLQAVVTLGDEANTWLAEEAEKKGCKVTRTSSPYEAGAYIAPLLTADTVVLVKGSQNRVFAEEAIKSLLQNKDDEKKLTRQTDYWMAKKAEQFKPNL